MKKGRNVFWGMLFLIGAVILLIGSSGYLDGFGFWSVLISIGLIGLLVDGITRKSYTTVLFSIAFLIIVNDTLLGLTAISPLPVLGAALLGSIGLNMLFPVKKKWNGNYVSGRNSAINSDVIDAVTGEEVTLSTRFGEAVKYITCKDLSKVQIDSSFGSLTVYFDNAVLKNGVANIYVNNSFASTILYIPSEWKVEIYVNNTLGTTQEKGQSNQHGSNILNIYGDVSFGLLEIRYI